MKRNRINIKSLMTFCMAVGLASGMLFTFQSCTEKIDDGNYAIADEPTITDYLAETPEYSKIKSIFDRVTLGHKAEASSLTAVLSARGNYTIFAPTNDAIDAYLAKINVSSVEQLDDEQAELIAYSCIIDNGTEEAYESPEFPSEGGAFTKSDLNDRAITCIESDADADGNTYYYINGAKNDETGEITKGCKVVAFDHKLSNGYLHGVSSVIAPSNEYVPDLIKAADNMHIMGALLHYTGWDAKLTDYMDRDYENADHEQTATFPNLATFYVAQHRYLGYTALVEPDEVYQKAGVPAAEGYNVDEGGTISNWDAVLNAIRPIAEAAYGTEDRDDLTSEDNAVNRFVAYHFLEGKMAYNKFVNHFCEYSYKWGDIMNPQQKECPVDLSDYFTTAGKYRSIVKITHKATDNPEYPSAMFANHTATGDADLVYPDDVITHRGLLFTATNNGNENNAKNGYYYPLDGILILDAETANALGNERIRYDITTVLPELMNSGYRSQEYAYFDDNNYFASITGCSDDTKLLYLTTAPRGANGWCDLEGDEFMVLGIYDFVLRLPPVPKSGTYEIRMGCSLNSLRGMCQIYFGDDPDNLTPVGLPFDMRMSTTDDNVGWFNESSLDDAQILEKDKNMRNQGYMKGPKGFTISNGEGTSLARDYSGNVRRIVTTKTLKANTSYYLRFKSCLDDDASQFFMDYFEYCPSNIYNGVDPEDKW